MRCKITFDEIPGLGTTQDDDIRVTRARLDDADRRERVEEARRLIYERGYVVNSQLVDDLLQAISEIPTLVGIPTCIEHATADVSSERVLGTYPSARRPGV